MSTREALALQIHKTRPSNDAPEYFMDAAENRAERILAANPDIALRSEVIEEAVRVVEGLPGMACHRWHEGSGSIWFGPAHTPNGESGGVR